MERFAKGKDRYDEVYGEGAADRLLGSLDGVAREVGRYGIEFNYGDIYRRPGLDLKQRQVATIASLVTLGGCDPQLAGHVKAARRVGLTAAEIQEVIVHCVQYAGFPRTLNALAFARTALESTEEGRS